jgi:hypothetical protein
MEKHEEIKLRKQLHSKDSFDIIEAINVLRESGNEIFVPDLARILCNTDNDEIHSLILKIFDDLKNKNTVSEIVNVLKDKSYEKEKRNLVSSCWKSGLNFSEELDVFFEIFVNDDFLTAFEAYTVLETNIPDMQPVNAMKHLNYLSKKKNEISIDRLELAAILETMLQD